MIEENAASAGRQWVTLVVAITKTAIMMLMVAHFLTCAWFYIGLNLGPELPMESWVEIALIAERADSGLHVGQPRFAPWALASRFQADVFAPPRAATHPNQIRRWAVC